MQARPKYPPAKRPITPTAAPENENPKKAIKRVETVMHENPKPSAAPSHCSSGPHHDEGAASNPAVCKRVPRSSFLCLLFLAKAIKRKGGIARFRVLPCVSLLSFEKGFLISRFSFSHQNSKRRGNGRLQSFSFRFLPARNSDNNCSDVPNATHLRTHAFH